MRGLLLAFVAGCWLLQQQGELPGATALLGGACVASMVVLVVSRVTRGVRRGWARCGRWTAGAAVALAAGFGWAAWRAEMRIEQWLDPAWAGRDLVVEGIVRGLPTEAEHGTRFLLGAETWPRSQENDDAEDDAELPGHPGHPGPSGPRRLLLTWQVPSASLRPGQRYRLTVRLRRPRGLANPHGFDYAYWLLSEGIAATGYVRSGVPLLEPEVGAGRPGREAGPRYEGLAVGRDGAVERAEILRPIPWPVRIAMWRFDLREHLRSAMPAGARYGPVLVALVIGDQRGIAPSDWEVFRRTGISHLVSISGLHITMLSGAAGALARTIWRHSFGMRRLLDARGWRSMPLVLPAQKAALVVAVLIALIYGAIAGMQIPALRTVTMLAVAAIALWSGRSPPASVVLAWAAALALFLDPWAVMSPGFWLSFGAVAVIFLYASRREPGQDTTRRRTETRVRRWLAGAGVALGNAARVQWAVTIGLVPLTLLLFGQVSVVSGIANAVAIPVVSLAVTPLALASAVVPHGVASPLLASAHVLLEWLVTGLSWLAAPDWAVWEAAYPGPLRLALALLGVVILLAPRSVGALAGPASSSRLQRRAWQRLPPRWVGVLMMVPMLSTGREPVARGEIRLTALDVGQGTAVLVETQHHSLLYDTGPAYASGTSAGGQVVVPFLRGSGVRRLDMLMISHEDADHAGGAGDVLHAVPVTGRLTAAPLDHPRLYGGEPGEWQPCIAGSHWDWDGVRFDVLNPSEGDLANAALTSNARSCVLRVATPQRAVLLTGDIEEREERRLLDQAQPEALRAHILVVPHHGSGTSSHAAFVRAVQPDMAIFQLGFANRYRHPRADVWQRYARAGAARYRTDETGAITVVTQRASHSVTTFRHRHRRYWRDAPPVPG